MKCSYCNSDVSENMNNCPNCGATINKIVASNNIEQNVQPTNLEPSQAPNITIVGGQLEDFQNNEVINNNVNKQKKKSHGFLIFILILVVIMILGYIIANKFYDKFPKEVQNIISPIIQNKQEVITEDGSEKDIVVPEKEYETEQEEVEKEPEEERLEGTFTTSELGLKNDVSNYTMNFAMKLNIDINGTPVSVNSTISGIVDVENKKTHYLIKSMSSGIITSSEMYGDYKTMESYIKSPDGSWAKSKDVTNYNNSSDDRIDFSFYYDLFDKNGGLTSLGIDDEYDYSFIIPKDYIKVNLDAQNLDSSLIKNDVKGYVKIKDNYIEEIEYDFSEFIEDINKYEIIIRFSKINNSDSVVIPDDVVNSNNI